MCRVQADIFRLNPRGMPAKCVNGIKEVDAVMALGRGEAGKEREIGLRGGVIAAKHVKGMAKVPVLLMAVPAPGGIRVGIMPVAGV